MPKPNLSVNGTRYFDWHEITLERSAERTPWQFEFSIERNWRTEATPPIKRGDSVSVRLGNELLITGYVDALPVDYSDSQHRFTVRGRSKLMDLVDCTSHGQTFKDQSLAQIATAICKPFGIKVRDEAKQTKAFGKKTLDEGQSFFDFLEELARMRAVRLMDSPEGDLVLINDTFETVDTALVLGENIVKASSEKSAERLFSEYAVVANNPNAFASAEDKSFPEGVKSGLLKRHRPLVIVISDEADNEECLRRADLHMRVNHARAEQTTYTVLGWTMNDGRAWFPACKVPVKDPYAGTNETLTIMGARLVLNPNGLKSELTVMPHYALNVIPVSEGEENAFGGDA